MRSVRSWLHAPTLRNPLEQRQAPLLQVVLLGLSVILVLYLPLQLSQTTLAFDSLATLALIAAMLPACIGAIWLIRHDRFAAGVLLIMAAMLVTGTGVGLLDHGPFSSKTQLTLIMPLCLAGLLLGRRGIVAMLVLNTLAGTIIELAAPSDSLIARGATPQMLAMDMVTFTFISMVIGLILDQFGASLRRSIGLLLERERELEGARLQLEGLVATEQRARAEAQRLQLAEAEGRRRLEQAVRDYLGFVQQVAAGRDAQPLTIDDDDALGQLGSGLNEMGASLSAAQAEARRLQCQEREDRERLERTVDHYLAFVQLVARGNLGQRLQVQEAGALGSLGHGLNQMVDSLQALTTQVQVAASNIAATAAEILAATTQQVASASEQSAALTQTTTTIEEVKAIAQQTAEQASQVARDSQVALGLTREGAQSVEQTMSGMRVVSGRVESIAETIMALADQTQVIGVIIQTVNELADQSNLLALNAAIEAARAGTQGKSFAIVAQHVRELAERSKAATAQVREILSEILQATNAAVMVTEEGTKGAEAGTRQAGQTGAMIHRIAAEVERGAQASVQMAAAAQQQTTGMEQIGSAMLAIQQATTQTLSSTRQAERAALDLNALARSLQSAVSAYQV